MSKMYPQIALVDILRHPYELVSGNGIVGDSAVAIILAVILFAFIFLMVVRIRA